jgi:Ice-binding-like
LRNAYVVISEGGTTINGDVGLGPDDTGELLKATINGTLYLDFTANPDIHPDLKITGGIVHEDLSGASDAAVAASANLAALAPTQTYGNINSSTTFTSSGGFNVIALNSVNLVKGTITIQGGASDVFVFNVRGGFNFSSSQMQLVGVNANNVLWNFPVSGSGDVDIFKAVTVADGVFLAPNRNAIVDQAIINGKVLAGGQIRIHSAATVQCP